MVALLMSLPLFKFLSAYRRYLNGPSEGQVFKKLEFHLS